MIKMASGTRQQSAAELRAELLHRVEERDRELYEERKELLLNEARLLVEAKIEATRAEVVSDLRGEFLDIGTLDTLRTDVLEEAETHFHQRVWDALSSGLEKKVRDLTASVASLRRLEREIIPSMSSQVSELQRQVRALADQHHVQPPTASEARAPHGVEESVRRLAQQVTALAGSLSTGPAPRDPAGDSLFAGVNAPHPEEVPVTSHSGTQPLATPPNVAAARAGIVEEVPRLTPLRARESAFDQVLSYRTYRLNTPDTWSSDPQRMERELRKVSKHVGNIRSFNPSFEEFDGREPIDVLRFLAELKDAADSTGVHEGAAVKMLPYFLRGEAQVYLAGIARKGKLLSGGARNFTWPHAVQALLIRYASDDALSAAYDSVTRITQAQAEDENAFADRLQDAALQCANVFTQRDLVNYFVKGLQPGIRSVVSNTVSRSDEEDFLAVRRIAQAQGETYRATRKEPIQPKPRLAPTREGAKKKSMYLGSDIRPPMTDTSSDSASAVGYQPWGLPQHPTLLLSGTTIPVPSSPSSMTSARTGESIDITGQPVRGRPLPFLRRLQCRRWMLNNWR